MLCFPNCKINLGLYVTKRRTDGYHNIETVFYPLMYQDVLEIIPAVTTTLHLSGIPVQGDVQSNLVWKAYDLLHNQYPDKVPSFDIYLHKIIPMGAGLGGGSADGTFMLQLLNDYCKLNLDRNMLSRLSIELGSDCPFFVCNSPQYATGRGDVMTEIAIDLLGYSIQLVTPIVHISTSRAFGMIKPKPATYDLTGLERLPITEWKNIIGNDFEGPIFEQYPLLANIKEQLYAQGAHYASMSGSGSSIYGIFPKGMKAHINTTLAFKDVFIA